MKGGEANRRAFARVPVTLPTRIPKGPARVATEEETSLEEETRLVKAAQAGDQAAFSKLVDKYWDRLYRWLFHVSRDAHAAEDVAQETFLKAFARIDRFAAGSNFRAWLFRIGHNNWVNVQRANRKQKSELTEDVDEIRPGPEQQASDRDSLRDLMEDVGKLTLDFRTALMLRAEGDLSFKDIADITGVPEETARWRVFKARQKLLAMRGYDEDDGEDSQ